MPSPTSAEAVRQLADAGHTSAVVVPLLFTEAFHATVDVPETVRSVTESVPLQLIVTDILGTGDDMAQLLRESMASSGIDDRASVLLFAVGSSMPAANEAVVDLAVRLTEDRRGLVRACFGTCSPGVADVMNGLPEPVAVVPLFLTDGLLLTSVRELATQRGWQMAEPLGERAAELVLLRYNGARTCRRSQLARLLALHYGHYGGARRPPVSTHRSLPRVGGEDRRVRDSVGR